MKEAQKNAPKVLAAARQSLLQEIAEIDTKEHICRFNDGEQSCDCYRAAINDIINKHKTAALITKLPTE